MKTYSTRGRADDFYVRLTKLRKSVRLSVHEGEDHESKGGHILTPREAEKLGNALQKMAYEVHSGVKT